jgi:hypothetical protein
VNALLGAVATFVIGVVPLIKIVAPVAGGAIAGYLRNTGVLDGAKVGAVAGIIGSTGLNFLAPPRFFGLFGGGIVGGFLLISILFASSSGSSPVPSAVPSGPGLPRTDGTDRDSVRPAVYIPTRGI